ncbi:family 20 glycosylhydrolase [Micromonospora sp. MW-13]|uniref:family 20 glycosylhydrolase n=1 Tax=Micromonospora sp. MW-13 TaxID=2094022 RepID=UPI001FB346E2|nr:family 20 glycosylhydrolase [Micromonospora sp. MW-13]
MAPADLPGRQPAAGELARAAARAAGDRLAPPAPVRLGDVVPAPERVEPDPAADFTLPADVVVRVHPDPAARDVAEQLATLLRPATGYPVPVTDTLADPAGGLTLTLAGTGPDIAGPAAGPDIAGPGARADGTGPGTGTDGAGPGARADSSGPGVAPARAADPDPGPAGTEPLGTEGYRLDVRSDGVRLTAATPAGLFHGVQTLRQLLPAAIESPTPVTERWTLPGGTIVDRPRFPYRGAMLDVARHFFAVADVLRVVDHLARYKLNHLHLHLTDDQGWRIAVDARPRLATVGGATEVGGGPGGCYTAADYRRIVRYAARQHVTVVPEIDLPGHTNAALTAYPELAPERVAPPPYTGTEVGFSYLDPADERTYAFVADVLGEVAARTPGPYLHIGGDEVFKVPADVYARFVERVQGIVAGTGKIVVGWHQIAPAGHAEGRILQWWGTQGDDPVAAEAVRRGARLILSPANHAYLDMKYAPDTPIGHDWAGLIDVARAYDWDPGTHLDGVPAEAVLGVEAPLWTESVTSLAEIEFMLLPRLPAVAELGWSPRRTHDWPAFRDRLAGHGPRWSGAGIAFHRAPEIPWPAQPQDAPPIPIQPHPDTTAGAAQTGTDHAPTPPR